MFSIGLTGGIASGKTTVSNLFEALGVAVVDTDVISRKLLEPDELAFRQVVGHFGKDILLSNGAIDRARLREIVFSNGQQKSWLETMLHPLIYQRSHDAMRAHSTAAYVLLVVPLLFESGFQSLVDRVLVIDCPAEQQVRRLIKRDGIDESLAQKMLAQQLGNPERIARAQDIIENRDDSDDLASQVAALHQSYLRLSANR
ncbi:MAG: dephospho-CoA kinase [Gammaproteobacteria bacterium]|nr:dephospho-CoA kinase [Gammaproteobacteria bacterium]